MTYETLNYEKENQLGIITLNRPKQLNALSSQMILELEHVTAEIAQDDDVRMVILTGGDKVFCVGADLKEQRENPSPLAPGARGGRFMDKIEALDKPVIAAVAGYAYGGGCELALVCDLRIAADTAKFGLPEIKIGSIPSAGGTQRLPRLIGIGKAKEMMYTGDPVDAQEAYRLGLANKVVPVASLLDEAKALGQTLLDRPPLSLKALKQCVNYGLKMDVDAGIEFEAKWTSILINTEDMKEGVAAFVEKRRPQFKGR